MYHTFDIPKSNHTSKSALPFAEDLPKSRIFLIFRRQIFAVFLLIQGWEHCDYHFRIHSWVIFAPSKMELNWASTSVTEQVRSFLCNIQKSRGRLADSFNAASAIRASDNPHSPSMATTTESTKPNHSKEIKVLSKYSILCTVQCFSSSEYILSKPIESSIIFYIE